MASKYDAPPFTVNMTKELDRRFHQFAHDTGIKRGDLARVGIETILNQRPEEIKSALSAMQQSES